MNKQLKLVLICFLVIVLAISIFTSAREQDSKIKKEKDVEIKENRIIENNGRGKIKFNDEFAAEIIDVEENPNVYIDNNVIAINTEELPELDKPATLTFYNVFFEDTPLIYYNEEFTTNPAEITEPCPADICSNINYDKETGTLSFDVSGFSSFSSYSEWWGGICYGYNVGGIFYKCGQPIENKCTNEPWTWFCQESCYSGYPNCVPTADCVYSEFNEPERGTSRYYTCKPKQCDAEISYGQCWYEGGISGAARFMSIGKSACFNDKLLKVCNNLDNDPCGEWQDTEISCDAERDDTMKYCVDAYGTHRDYCKNYEGEMVGMIYLPMGKLNGEKTIWDRTKTMQYPVSITEVSCNEAIKEFCGGKLCIDGECKAPTCNYEGTLIDFDTQTTFEQPAKNYNFGELICPFESKRWQTCEKCGVWEGENSCYAKRNDTEGNCEDGYGNYEDYCKDEDEDGIEETLVKYNAAYDPNVQYVLTQCGTGTESTFQLSKKDCQEEETNCAEQGKVCVKASAARCNTPPDVGVSLSPQDPDPNNPAPYTGNGSNPYTNANLNCIGIVTDPDKEDKELKVSYSVEGGNGPDIFETGSTNPTPSSPLTCTKEEDKDYCTINVTISAAYTKVNDTIICKMTPNDGHADGKEENATIFIAQDLDLFITDIKPVQAVEDAPLIAFKDMMVRVFANFSSVLDIDKINDVTVILTIEYYDISGNKYNTKTYTTSKTIEREYEIKRKFMAEDTFNFGNVMPPLKKGKIKLIAQIDPNNIIPERDKNNIKIIEKVKVGEIKYTHYHEYIPVGVYGWATATTINVNNLCDSSHEFLLSTYPIPESKLIKNCEEDVLYVSYLPNTPLSLFSIAILEQLSYVAFLYSGATREIGVVPDGTLEGSRGISFPLFVNNAILIEEDAPEWVAAHEIGHTYGFCDGYETGASRWLPNPECDSNPSFGEDWDEDTYPYGYVAANGWDVKNNIPKISVEPNDFQSFWNHYSLMGAANLLNALVMEPLTWIDSREYNLLLSKLTTVPNDPNLLLIGVKINTNDSVELLPWYELGDGIPSDITPGDYFVEFISLNGELLETVNFQPAEIKDGNLSFSESLFAVVYPEETNKVIIKHKDKILKEVIKGKPPFIDIKLIREKDRIYEVKWIVRDQDSKDLYYSLGYSCNNGNWKPIIINTQKTSHSFDGSNIPKNSTCILKLIATDGLNTVRINKTFASEESQIECNDNGIHLGNNKPDCHEDQGKDKSEGKEKIRH